jgi:hypothetical protein
MIIRNALKCNKCGDVIQSTYTHDYVECSCGSTIVDGGNSYLRWGGNDFTDLSISTDKQYVPHSAQLEHSEVILAAHHPDTCVGSVCALHKRTDHKMRGWQQSLDMLGKTFVMTRVCPHGIAHTDPDDFFVYDVDYCKKCDAGRKEIVYA